MAGASGEQPMSEQQRSEAEAAETLEHAQLRAQLEEATLPLMLDAMWAANVLDIESTLQHVCKKVRFVGIRCTTKVPCYAALACRDQNVNILS